MGKKGKRPADTGGRKKNPRLWQLLLAVVVIGGMVSAYVLWSRDSSSDAQTTLASQSPSGLESVSTIPSLRNRLVLPARPQRPRPFTLSPDRYTEPETKRAYQAAKDVPDVLEGVPCYCGCYANSGHRNNLDCFKDSHGET